MKLVEVRNEHVLELNETIRLLHSATKDNEHHQQKVWCLYNSSYKSQLYANFPTTFIDVRLRNPSQAMNKVRDELNAEKAKNGQLVLEVHRMIDAIAFDCCYRMRRPRKIWKRRMIS